MSSSRIFGRLVAHPEVGFKRRRWIRCRQIPRQCSVTWLLLVASVCGLGDCCNAQAPVGVNAAADAVEVPWLTELSAAKTKSAILGKPIFLKFSADWCGPCHELSAEFQRPEFSEISDNVILVEVDIDKSPEIANEFAVSAIPAVAMIDSDGNVLDVKTGFAELTHWLAWVNENLERAKRQLPTALQSTDAPTRTEVTDLLAHLGERDPTLRQLAMEKLAGFPAQTRAVLVGALKQPGQLERKLAVIDILERWQAPVAGLDPWVAPRFAQESLKPLARWLDTPLEDIQPQIELSVENLAQAQREIDLLLKTRNVRGSLARLTRYGDQLLPTIYDRIRDVQSDEDLQRLTALRFWLTASNQLRLGWAGGIVELASPDLSARRAAMNVLVQRVVDADEPLLMELFANADPLVRELSLKGLQRIGSKRNSDTMARLLRDPDKNVRVAVLKQFTEAESAEMSDEVIEYLKTETDDDLIVQALRFLRTCKGDEVMTSILSLAKHDSWRVRAEVAEAIGKVSNSDLSTKVKKSRDESLLKLIEDTDGFVVNRAAKSLPEEKSEEVINKLFELADSNPQSGKELIAEMVDAAYNSERKSKLLPPVKERLTSPRSEIRVMALDALASMAPESLDDEVLLPFLMDKNSDVRQSGMRAVSVYCNWLKNEITDEVDLGQDANGTNRMINIAPRRPSLTSSLTWFFKSNKKSAQDAPTPVEITLESADEDSTEEAASATPVADAREVNAEDSEVANQALLPPLLRERWLEKWQAGEIETPLSKSIELIESMPTPEAEDELEAINLCLAILGDQQVFDQMFETRSENEKTTDQWVALLTWQSPQRRADAIKQAGARGIDESQMALLLSTVSQIRNPELFDVLVELPQLYDVEMYSLRRDLQKLFFGSTLPYWQDYDPEDGKIPQPLLDNYIQRLKKLAEADSVNRQILALALISPIDYQTSIDMAAGFLDSESPRLQDLALRISLKPVHVAGGQGEPSRTNGLKFLQSDSAWKPKQLWQVNTIFRYLIAGEDGLDEGTYFSDRLRISSGRHQFFGGYGGEPEQTKVKIPQAPDGLTLEMLKLPGDITPEQAVEDLEFSAQRDYLQILLGQEIKATAVIDWYQKKPTEESGRMLYQSIATLNDDQNVHFVESIFDAFSDDTRYSANLYWTIRIMDGKNALRLRKKIRSKIGMSNLKNY